MHLTKEILNQCMPPVRKPNDVAARDIILEKFILPLNAAMAKYHIDTPARCAAFLAQVFHESGCFRWMKELASGEAYDTGSKAKSLGNTPEKDGDGEKYVGRGPIQITGYTNYFNLTRDIGIKDLDFTANPELLELPLYGCLAAGWFWNSRKLNDLADQGKFETITKRINGGLNGYADRLKHWERCKKTLGV